jgi:hypothetical protein
MVEYKCFRCEYSTNHKSNMIKHINNKKICKLVGLDVVPKKYESLMLLGNNESVLELLKKNLEMEGELRELRKRVMHIEIKGNNNNANNTTNNITNNNNITINLLPMDDPNIEFLTDRDYEKFINKNIDKIIPAMLKKIHFNREHPENHNICITNFKNSLGFVHNGEKWETILKKELINKIMDHNEILLNDWVNEKDNEEYNEKMNDFVKSKDDREALNNIKQEIKKTVYNNRGMCKMK